MKMKIAFFKILSVWESDEQNVIRAPSVGLKFKVKSDEAGLKRYFCRLFVVDQLLSTINQVNI